MGHIFALSGCSGSGKTTFLNEIFKNNPMQLRLLVRSTSRPIRKNEYEGVDYEYLSINGFMQKLFANDYVHVEQIGDSFFGIDAHLIEETISSDDDGIIMAGRGAIHLKTIYGSNATVLFLHSGTRRSLLNPS